MIEIASAKLGYAGKDQDRVVVRKLSHGYLLGVADGVSMDAGRAAAEWVRDFLLRTDETSSLHELFAAMCSELRSSCVDELESKTTLTCGLLTEAEESGRLHFQFFAVGDSPIWRVVRSGNLRYPYQRYVVHSGPYPAETAKLYSTISIGEQKVTGVVSFGAVEVDFDELLVVCSDGVPEREVFVRDLSIQAEGGQTLLRTLFSDSMLTDQSLLDAIVDYAIRDVLADDVAIIVARVTAAQTRGEVIEIELDASSVQNDSPLLPPHAEGSPIAAEVCPDEGAIVAAGSATISTDQKRKSSRQAEILYPKGTVLRLSGTEKVATVKSKYHVIFEDRRYYLLTLTRLLLQRDALDYDATLYWESTDPK